MGELQEGAELALLFLQAADLGLGTTYVGMFDPEKLTAAFPAMAGLVPIAMLPLGYPAEEIKRAPKKAFDERARFNGWAREPQA